MTTAPQTTLSPISADTLVTDNAQALFREQVDAIVRFDEMSEAMSVMRMMEKLIADTNLAVVSPAAAEAYRAGIRKLEWIALPLLPQRAILEMIETRLGEAFVLPDYHLMDKLDYALTGKGLDERDQFKKQAREAIYRSKELLTTTPVHIGEQEHRGLVMNWIRLYNREVGTGTLDLVRQSQFFVQNKSVAALSEGERALLKNVADLVEYLKRSSLTPEGFEEIVPISEGDVRGDMIHGVVTKFDMKKYQRMADELAARAAVLRGGVAEVRKEIPKSIPEKKIVVVAPPTQLLTPTEQQQIGEVKKQLLATGNDPVAILYDMILHPQGRTVTPVMRLAGLVVLAEANAVERALKDQKIAALFQKHLQKHGDATTREGFRLTPTAPKFVRFFFRWVLEERAKFSEPDAARMAVHLVNTLRKQGNDRYMRIAYFDSGDGVFKWT